MRKVVFDIGPATWVAIVIMSFAYVIGAYLSH
jgi:hypothetical protein